MSKMHLLWSLKIIFLSAFGLCLYLVIIPVLVPVLLLFSLWYFAFKLILKLQYGSDVYKPNGRDVVHGRQPAANIWPILNLAVRVEGPLNLDLMKERMKNSIENAVNENGQKRYKRLKELYVKKFGYSVWKKFDKFDINDHVLLVQPSDVISDKQNKEQSPLVSETNQENNNFVLNQRSSTSNNEGNEQLNPEVPWEVTVKNFLNAYGSQPFPEGLPPWNVLVLDERNGKYTFLLRSHHAISDGINCMRMFTEDMLDEPCKIFQSFQPQSKIVKYVTLFTSFWLLPFEVLKMMTKHDKNPLHGTVPITGKLKYYISNQIPMETFQHIRKKTHVSLHTIGYSCISAAVSLHFQRRGVTKDTINIFAPVPLQNPSRDVQMKNNFNLAVITLPTLTNKRLFKKSHTDECYHKNKICNFNSLERMARVQLSLDETKRNLASPILNNLMSLISSMLPEKLTNMLLSSKGYTMTITSLPGSKTESKIWSGTQLEQLFWISLLDPLVVGFSIMGYNGNLRFGLILDDSVLLDEKEGDNIMRDIEIELKNIARELEEADLRNFPGLKEVV